MYTPNKITHREYEWSNTAKPHVAGGVPVLRWCSFVLSWWCTGKLVEDGLKTNETCSGKGHIVEREAEG